tara:strand:+ start:114 stop:458 length:345 start_codon:yes stop_codon:yes gene_type:complete
MSNLSREEILASSKGWVASLLNLLPGLGSGYLYQRRWKPYFLTIAASATWFSLGVIFQVNKETAQYEQIIGVTGLFFISLVTVIEANLAFKNAINKLKSDQEKIKPAIKKGWFK